MRQKVGDETDNSGAKFNRHEDKDTSIEAPTGDHSTHSNGVNPRKNLGGAGGVSNEVGATGRGLKATATARANEESLTDGLIGAAATHEKVEALVANSRNAASFAYAEEESDAKKIPEVAVASNEEEVLTKTSENVATDAATAVEVATQVSVQKSQPISEVPRKSSAKVEDARKAPEDVLSGYEAPPAADVMTAAKASDGSDVNDSYVAPAASEVLEASNGSATEVTSSKAAVVKEEVPSAETVPLEGLQPDEATALVWAKLRAFAATKGETGVRELFSQFDADSSGTLDKNEFKSALATVGLPGASNKVVETVMKAASQGEGAGGSKKRLDYASFAAALKAP